MLIGICGKAGSGKILEPFKLFFKEYYVKLVKFYGDEK